MKRAQIMQQQIEQERARQAEFQHAIDALCQQEQEPLIQEPLLKQPPLQQFLMCYEAAVASSGGNDTTLSKSFIISLKSIATNWYVRLHPRPITSCSQLKEKFRVNFQGFQAELNTE
jgi:hypothetical protein